jgi:hypothetical protein
MAAGAAGQKRDFLWQETEKRARYKIRDESFKIQSIPAAAFLAWGVVQSVGRCTVNADGVGSNPTAPANSGNREFQRYSKKRRNLFRVEKHTPAA